MKRIHSEERKGGAGRRGTLSPNEGFERRIMMYALAAGAVAVCAPAAEAKVVFTPSNLVLKAPPPPVHLDIDLNHDGHTDFRLSDLAFGTRLSGGGILSVKGAAGNGIVGGRNNFGIGASALTVGTKIGSSANFVSQGKLESSFRTNVNGGSDNGCFGNFAFVTDRFLGVRFLFKGEIHYGWIQFRSVSCGLAKLGGFAYETVPNKPILAGDRGQEDSATLRSSEPTSLELLAAGNVAMPDWRRRAG
jgi:hypothetical protein